jgi:hypothetical protein
MFAVVDVFSRFAYIIPMKNKDIESTSKAIEEVLSYNKIKPNLIMSDNDSSFTGLEFQKVLVKNDIHHDPNAVGDHNSLLIIDEAQNLRSYMDIKQVFDPLTNELLGDQANTNKKGYTIWKYGAMKAHKILLLTGTAFVNSLYDIENLLSMIDERKPHSVETFSDIIKSPSNVSDYFSYRISYYESPKSNFFPERKEIIVPLYMTKEEEQKYFKIQDKGRPKSKSKKPNSFYSAEKYASNAIIGKDGINPKMKWTIDKIKKNPNQKFIIYSGLMQNGINMSFGNKFLMPCGLDIFEPILKIIRLKKNAEIPIN